MNGIGKERPMDDFTRELVVDFLDEAFSLIDNFEESLLVLEKNPKDSKAINEVFRVAHTIKGGAGTVGFDEIQSFTHKMEDVFDLVRKGTLTLDWNQISMLLECRDELEKMLNFRSENLNETYHSEKVEALLARLASLKASAGTAPAQASQPVQSPKPAASAPAPAAADTSESSLSNYEFSLINEFISHGKNVFLLKYTLNENYEMKEVSAFQLYALLNDISEIIKVSPPIEELETRFSPTILFVISSDKDDEFIREKTYLNEMIKQIEIVRIDAGKLQELESAAAGSAQASRPAQAAKPAETSPSPSAPAAQEAEQDAGDDKLEKRNLATLRIESWKVDNLLNLLGELVLTKATFAQLNSDVEKITIDLKNTLKEFLSGINRLNLSGDAETVKEKNEIVLTSLNKLFTSAEVFAENIQKFNRISSSMQENVMNMRMVPIQMVFSRFPRLIRDIAGKMQKKIDLEIEGVETEIDKGMVDDIFDPLIHLLRNAVDHGIESPEERKRLGKPETGKITLKATHEGDSIVIEVADDGKGVDTDKIRQKIIARGMYSKEAADKMTNRDLLSLIFLPGFSTADEVSNLSGRGVGMDAVKRKIEEIGGTVGVSTVKGKGTRIMIRLPLTLAIIQGLLVVVEGMYYIIPVASVEETVIIASKDFKEVNGHLAMDFREKLVPILPLKKYFYGIEMKTGALNADKEYCIITKYGDRSVGIIVGEVIGEQDIVIKPLNTKLIKSPGISAATIVGNGEIGYIIDPSQVISHYFKTMK